jgi:hypothetical protein
MRRQQRMIMDCYLQPNDRPTNSMSMNLGWHLDVCAKSLSSPQHSMSVVDEGIPSIPGNLDDSFRRVRHIFQSSPERIDSNASHGFVDAISSLVHLEPYKKDHGLSANTVDLTITRPNSFGQPSSASQQLCTQSSAQESPLSSNLMEFTRSASINRRPLSVPTSMPSSVTADSAVPLLVGESEKTRRARHAANQRHSKTKRARKDNHQAYSNSEATVLADERTQRHREKNKMGAAKRRLRQRKQVQTIQVNLPPPCPTSKEFAIVFNKFNTGRSYSLAEAVRKVAAAKAVVWFITREETF